MSQYHLLIRKPNRSNTTILSVIEIVLVIEEFGELLTEITSNEDKIKTLIELSCTI